MFQERIPGGDDCLWTVGSYVDAGGRALGVFCGRKLLQAPRGAGTCRVGEAVWDGTAVEGALRLLVELGFHGISQVEYKRDPRDGSLRLMEVNARLWQWHSLASDCGVDLVVQAYRDAIGLPVPALTSEHAGRRRWVALVRHLRESRREHLGMRRTLSPLRPPFSEPVFSLRDPMPGVHQVVGALRTSRNGPRE
jgi:predicted ATP-grasp superfamily ATP-dependent carboligase